MSKGIYCYIDNENDEIVYVGRDSYIDTNERHKDHFYPSQYDKQQINRVLQNNPDRYTYKRLWEIEDCTDNHLNEMEKYYTKIYDPKFSFTEGGDGVSGYKWTDEQKEKISGENNHMYGRTGENHPMYGRTGENHPVYGRKHTEEERKKISKNHADVSGKNHPCAKYRFWDISSVYYEKRAMFQDGREPNPCRCFRYKYNGYRLPIGYFHDFLTLQIINNLVSDALSED